MSSFRVASELLVVESVVGLDVVVLVDAVVEPIFAALFSLEDGQKKKISRKSIKMYRQCVPRRRRNRGRRDLATLFAQVVVIGITVDFLRECKNLALWGKILYHILFAYLRPLSIFLRFRLSFWDGCFRFLSFQNIRKGFSCLMYKYKEGRGPRARDGGKYGGE